MEIADTLRSVENSVRDLISYLLTKKFGVHWKDSCGLSPERLAAWEERRAIEEKKLGRSDSRLIYYADFYDLFPLIKKNWECGFAEVFGSLREIEVFLGILENLRNPDAHRRDLLLFEKQIAAGISGKLRANITSYFSKMDTGDSYYPRIESIQDSLGNSWALGSRRPFVTPSVLRPGDHIQFTVAGSDPLGEPLEYTVLPMVSPHKFEWSTTGTFEVGIEEAHVQKELWMFVAVRSPRQYHAMRGPGIGAVDDIVQFRYEVLPPRNAQIKKG